MADESPTPHEVTRHKTTVLRSNSYTDDDGNVHVSEGSKEIDEIVEIRERECPECGYDRATTTRRSDNDRITRAECNACGSFDYPYVEADNL